MHNAAALCVTASARHTIRLIVPECKRFLNTVLASSFTSYIK